MRKFEDYFSFESILGELVRQRVAGKKDTMDVLPPRKRWMRQGCFEREQMSSEAIQRSSILRRVYSEQRNGTLDTSPWGKKLIALIDGVRDAVLKDGVEFEAPRIINIPKGNKDGHLEFRSVASFDRLQDRLILSRTTAYVRDVLEEVLSPNCYSFRRDGSISHRTAIEYLQAWRGQFENRSLWVAECDICKFFDNISHSVVRHVWSKTRGIVFSPYATRVMEAYLNVYSASTQERRGIPQGGVFSTVLANLVLLAADKAVLKGRSKCLFYARYCDDVIIAHPWRSVCSSRLNAYKEALEGLDLPIHPIEDFVYCPKDGSTTKYYSLKSKGPFRWRCPKRGERNVASWVSFLGCQIRYNGETRIRKESLEKHIHSLGLATSKAVNLNSAVGR